MNELDQVVSKASIIGLEDAYIHKRQSHGYNRDYPMIIWWLSPYLYTYVEAPKQSSKLAPAVYNKATSKVCCQ